MSDAQPPACTREQLLAVACPVCAAPIGAYCEERPGKVLLLKNHHEERYWIAASAAKGSADGLN